MEWAWGGGAEVNQTFSLALSTGAPKKKKVVDMRTIFRTPSNNLTPAHGGRVLEPLLPGDLSVGLVVCRSTGLM